MLKEMIAERYAIVRRNGKVEYYQNHITLEEAKEYIALSEKRGWGWTIKEYNEEELRKYVLLNGWKNGLL